MAHFVFPEPHAAAFAVDMGVAASRVSTIPDVFDPEMAIVPGSHAARADLRLDSRFTILLSFGSVGLGRRMLDFLRLLKMARVSTQVIINPGRNKRLRAQVTRYLDASTRLVEPDASLVPYVAAADVVVGKAGWLTLTEATALGTPTLILDHIKGQEDENVRVACLSGGCAMRNTGSSCRLYSTVCQRRFEHGPGLSGCGGGVPSEGREPARP